MTCQSGRNSANFWSRKLTSDDVYLIRELYKERAKLEQTLLEHKAQIKLLREELRQVSVAAIGRKFGVSQQHVHRIVTGQTRVDYEDEEEDTGYDPRD